MVLSCPYPHPCLCSQKKCFICTKIKLKDSKTEDQQMIYENPPRIKSKPHFDQDIFHREVKQSSRQTSQLLFSIIYRTVSGLDETPSAASCSVIRENFGMSRKRWPHVQEISFVSHDAPLVKVLLLFSVSRELSKSNRYVSIFAMVWAQGRKLDL